LFSLAVGGLGFDTFEIRTKKSVGVDMVQTSLKWCISSKKKSYL